MSYRTPAIALALVVCATVAAAAIAKQRHLPEHGQRYSPEYTASGWGFFNFNHSEPKASTAKVKPREECAFCHIASAKKDEVWTQFYRLLDY
jgi:hypothetical protein